MLDSTPYHGGSGQVGCNSISPIPSRHSPIIISWRNHLLSSVIHFGEDPKMSVDATMFLDDEIEESHIQHTTMM